MQNKDLIVGQKLDMPEGDVFLVKKKTKTNIIFVNLSTGEEHKQNLKNFFFGKIIKI